MIVLRWPAWDYWIPLSLSLIAWYLNLCDRELTSGGVIRLGSTLSCKYPKTLLGFVCFSLHQSFPKCSLDFLCCSISFSNFILFLMHYDNSLLPTSLYISCDSFNNILLWRYIVPTKIARGGGRGPGKNGAYEESINDQLCVK